MDKNVKNEGKEHYGVKYCGYIIYFDTPKAREDFIKEKQEELKLNKKKAS